MQSVRALIAGVVFIGVLGGCVGSIHPLYTDADVYFDSALVGKWEDTATRTIYSLSPATNSKAYILQIQQETNSLEYTAHLIRFDDVFIMDIFPKAPEALRDQEMQWPSFLALHTFVRVNRTESADRLEVQFLGDSQIRALLESTPGVIACTVRNDDDAPLLAREKLILTADTPALQTFFRKYVINDRGTWRAPITLRYAKGQHGLP